MNFLDKIKNFFNDERDAMSTLDDSPSFHVMTDAEKEYEREKLHSLINSHPIPAKRLEEIEQRDVSAD